MELFRLYANSLAGTVVYDTDVPDTANLAVTLSGLERLVPVIHKIVTPPAKVPEVDPRWERYTGLYSDPSWYDTEVMIYKGRLALNNFSYPPDDDPAGGLVFLTPAGRDTFVMDGPNGNGEKVVFIMDENDKVEKVKVGENYIYPKTTD
jgi:hypothetical protein